MISSKVFELMKMLVHSNNSYTPTPDSSSSTSNTLESPNNFSTTQHHIQKSSSSLCLQQPQQKQYMGFRSSVHSQAPLYATSILDSPTLARVERARLRLEASTQQQNLNDSCGSIINNLYAEDCFEKVAPDSNKQSLLTGRVPVSSMTGPIKRGLLWQQRDRIFSRWKERYFVLTRDYLHCFKRASGSSNGRASDMGQFIFKVKLVDIDKVEWLNRRSHSAIRLLLGREGRILLRCDEGLEDWFELLEECTLISKERRKALKFAQGPRSRASLAAPVSHASLQGKHSGLDGTCLRALDDWLNTSGVRGQKLLTNSIYDYGESNTFLFSDSVPDLSVLGNENHNHISGLSTNHSTPQKIPYSVSNNSSRYSNSYISQNNSFSNCNALYGSPQRILIKNSFALTRVVDEKNEDNEVELRRPCIFQHLNMENGNVLDRDWLYRKPTAPTDMRHSVQPMLPTHNNTSLSKPITDLDFSTHDSGMDTPSSTHRPSSYREQPRNKMHAPTMTSGNHAENFVSPFHGTSLNSPGGSCRSKQIPNHRQYVSKLSQHNALHGSHYSIQERPSKTRNYEEFNISTKTKNGLYYNKPCDPNHNQYNKNDSQSAKTVISQNSPKITQHIHSHSNQMQTQCEAANCHDNDNTDNDNINANNGNVQNVSAVFRERYQHPALAAIINESQGIKFRDRSFSDCQQISSRRSINNNNPSPSTSRMNHVNPTFSTPTRV